MDKTIKSKTFFYEKVIEHTPHPLHAIKELSTVIKPGGLVIITVPCRLWNPITKLATVLKLRPYHGYENFLWPGEPRNSLEKLGLTIEKIKDLIFVHFFQENKCTF